MLDALIPPVMRDENTAEVKMRERLRLGALLLLIALLIALLVAGLALGSRQMGAKQRALRDISPAERQALLHRELESLRTLCASRPRDSIWDAQFQARAAFVLEFPECNPGCQSFARSNLPHAIR